MEIALQQTALKTSWFLATVVLLTTMQAAAHSRETVLDDFEGPETSWIDAGDNGTYQLDEHRRLQSGARFGEWAEQIRVSAFQLETVYFAHDLSPARVVEELSLGLWVKADRGGLQFFARVVLPRTIDPKTGKPVKIYVPGATYKDPGSWQHLRINKFESLIAREVRNLLWKSELSVDSKEAYVDRVVLNVYGGPGMTSVLIDNLTVEGYVPREAVRTPSPVKLASAEFPVAEPTWPHVLLNSTVLTVDEQPFFPRIIQHRGEPLEFLAKLGFNVVEVAEVPTVEFLAEARRLKLWLIAPPPPGAIGSGYDPVLAWNLGRQLTNRELEATISKARSVRMADNSRARPLICSADTSLRSYSRHIDIMLTCRRPLASSLELADYGTWLRNCPRLVGPGTPIWSTIQTAPSPELQAQAAAFIGDASAVLTIDDEAMRLMVHTAIASGARGLVFESHGRLDEATPAAKRRAAALELINLELDVLEPWTAAGRTAGMAASSDPRIQGAILQTSKARVILPLRTSLGAQYIPVHTPGAISFLVPGVPQADDFYELTQAGVQPLRSKRRMAGGVQITLEEFGLTSMIVTTSQPSIYGTLFQRFANSSRRTVELQQFLIQTALEEVQTVNNKLGSERAIAGSTESVALIQASLNEAERLRQQDDYRACVQSLTKASNEVRALRRRIWEQAVLTMGSPVASSLTACFATLPDQWRLIERLRSAQFQQNQMPAGDFENLDQLVASRWQHVALVQPDTTSVVELSDKAPHNGRSSLKLQVSPLQEKAAPELVETPPLWVVSAPVPVQAGELLCIRGWVRIEQPITGSVDGLMVVDSIGGEPLALRLGQTGGWREFVLYRIAPAAGELTVTFALTGIGEAWVDDLSVQRVDLSSAAPPQMQHAQQPQPVTAERQRF